MNCLFLYCRMRTNFPFFLCLILLDTFGLCLNKSYERANKKVMTLVVTDTAGDLLNYVNLETHEDTITWLHSRLNLRPTVNLTLLQFK